MTDIVERLRKGPVAYSLPSGDVYHGPSALHTDAANEIERLRKLIDAAMISDVEDFAEERARAETAEAQVTTLTEAVEREREECAKVVDQQIHELERLGEQAFKGLIHDLRHVAAAIRTRTHTERKGP